MQDNMTYITRTITKCDSMSQQHSMDKLFKSYYPPRNWQRKCFSLGEVAQSERILYNEIKIVVTIIIKLAKVFKSQPKDNSPNI